jgi:hypothetical protein
MSSPPVPPSLDQLGHRAFSFYPPILNIEHNEWIFRRGTWSEILVLNTKTQSELWVPRRFLGEVSSVEEPVMIVGLSKELEWKAGMVLPHERRVIEMPRAINDSPPPQPSTPAASAPVVGIRLESRAESRISRLILGAMVLGIVACVVVVALFRDSGSRVRYTTVEQTNLGLTGRDDFFSVVSKLGTPADDRWRSDQGELQYRALGYPQLGVVLILMGSDRNSAHYIGAMDKSWKVVHSVPLPGGRDSSAILKGLKRF